MERKVLFVATVSSHIKAFHLPYLKWFKENGFEVHVACNAATGYEKRDSDIAEPNILFCDKWHNVPFSRGPLDKRNVTAYSQIKRIIDENNYSIIHTHTPVASALVRLAVKKARQKGTAVIYTAHGFHFYKGSSISKWLFFYPVEKWLSRYTDCLITINDEDYNVAINRHFKATDIVKINGVGIDIARFSSVSEITKEKCENIDKNTITKEKTDAEKIVDLGVAKRSDINRDLSINTSGDIETDIRVDAEINVGTNMKTSDRSEASIVLLSVGELSKRKNQEIAIRAVQELNDKNIVLLICGAGNLEEYLRTLAQGLGVENQVKFLGYVNNTEEVYSVSDVLVFPSLQEGLPVAVMEAMAAGLPIVATSIRGNRDLVKDGQGGFLVEKADDYKGFAEKIRLLKDSHEKRMKFGEFNKEYIKDYSIENITKEMEKIYTKYCKNAR